MRVAAVFLAFLLLPCSAWAFWPVYWEMEGEKNVLGPLISFEEKDERARITVRPLLSTYDAPRTFSYLWPLGKSTPEDSYFLPFYRRKSTDHQSSFELFPFFFGHAKEKTYGGVFPFYGKLYDRYRRDEIGFFLWPLYGYSRYGDTARTDVVWPFFSRWKGRETGFKLGPLYGVHHWGDERRSTFFLWPFITKEERDLTTDNPKSSLWIMPLYLQTTSPKSAYYGVLWPFFTYTRVEDRTEVNAPWPFFSITKGKERTGFSIWPVYSSARNEKDETKYILWPIYKDDRRQVGDATWVDRRVLLLNRYTVDNRGTFLNVWPLFEYRASPDQTSNIFFPSIIPWRDSQFDRIVRPLLTIYTLKRGPDRESSNLLYGLYTKEQSGDSWKRRLAFLFEVKHEQQGYGFEVLSGLFGVDRERMKIFYIPFSRKQTMTPEAVSDP
jgi:hypothetical protein